MNFKPQNHIILSHEVSWRQTSRIHMDWKEKYTLPSSMVPSHSWIQGNLRWRLQGTWSQRNLCKGIISPKGLLASLPHPTFFLKGASEVTSDPRICFKHASCYSSQAFEKEVDPREDWDTLMSFDRSPWSSGVFKRPKLNHVALFNLWLCPC